MAKSKWEKKACGCVKTELSIGPAIIRCAGHHGKPDKKGRAVLHLDADGIVRQEGHVPQEPEPRSAEPREEYVYFLRVGKRIKIGYSGDPERRSRDLQAELIGFAPGGRQLEAALHYQLREYRDTREWYRDKPAVQVAMNKVLNRA